MAAVGDSREHTQVDQDHTSPTSEHRSRHDSDEEQEDGDEEEDEEEREPTLKYTKLTSHLASVYRNGDSTSSSLVTADKLVS